ncbi:histidinol-phosphate phosphatase family protein [Rhodopirellula maiorica SM1]|uniref:D,D-heptose 1,7-bisphosphate phosphatase n=1 Tax=Rhodopirellula maiorica SM1 TaxID=1265738 RepID=M5RUK2_9BACT|nr:HAD family hydrolase [Rhodopirellula maiorica]EMI17649.1 histidinol-phosphate phosphatase family protein [Rhodopirellula maiorica SM1]
MVIRRCVFLDRDGVINVKADEGEYIHNWDEFQWIPNTIDWIRLFNALDFLVIVVTNQRGVARGKMTQANVDAIHEQMVRELAKKDAIINDVFVCPHEIGTCHCRKPQPGMIHAARDKWNIDVERSLMIGDSESDRQLASNCEMRFIQVRDGRICGKTLQHVIARLGDDCADG